MRDSGINERADLKAKAVGTDPERPRRLSLKRSRCAARACRLLTVPSGHPSVRAASWCDWLSRSQSKSGSRYRSGSRSISSCRTLGIVFAVFDRSRPHLCEPRRSQLRGRPSQRRRPGASGNPAGDGRQPGTERLMDDQAAGLGGQDEEGRLKRIFGIAFVAGNRFADAQDGRSVPLDEHRECKLGGFTVIGQEPREQLTVGQAAETARLEESTVMAKTGSLLERFIVSSSASQPADTHNAGWGSAGSTYFFCSLDPEGRFLRQVLDGCGGEPLT